MKIELEANTSQLRTLINLIGDDPKLQDIKHQLTSAQVDKDDSQSDEIPEEGDNEIIERME